MALEGNALIGQSGGPTIVINASLAGAIQAGQQRDEIDTFYGAVHGMEGILNEQIADLSQEDDEVIDRLSRVPSAALGTCRLKPTDEDLERCMEVFKAHNIRYFFYNGGDDSQLACHRISELAKASDWDMQVVGIPKTIDNDLVITDNCPGFGSAARLAGTATQCVAKDAEAFGTIEVVEIMGRHAGWLTGATQAGRLDEYMGPHLVYLPEVEIDPDRFLADCHELYDKHGYLVIAVSEGFTFGESDVMTTSEKVDEFGHARLGGVAKALSNMVEEEIGVRGRYDELGNLQRSFAWCASRPDIDQAFAVGYDAVDRACDGDNDVMITLERISNDPFEFTTDTTALVNVAGETREVPHEWINENNNGVNEEFIEYVTPLIEGFAEPLPKQLPHFPSLRKETVEPQLEPYVREAD